MKRIINQPDHIMIYLHVSINRDLKSKAMKEELRVEEKEKNLLSNLNKWSQVIKRK